MPTVASVEPANAATWIYRNRPVTVRLQRTDSTDYLKTETSQADFAAGTLVDVEAVASNALKLLSLAQTVDDFEDDTIGQLPGGWNVQFGGGHTIQSEGGSQKVRHQTTTGRSAIRWTDQGQVADAKIKVKIKTDSTVTFPGIAVRLGGGAGTEQGYLLELLSGGTQWGLYKVVNGTATQLGSLQSFTWSAGTEYWLNLQAISTAIKAKVWAASGSEPSGWGVEVTNGDITAAGYIGIWSYVASGAAAIYYDLFTHIGVGTPAFQTSGNRISPAYALSSVGKFGTAVIDWDATLPASTSLVMKVSKNGTSWTTVANGDRIVLWTEGDNLAAESLYLKEELATTDVAVSPTLSEVRVAFRPLDPALVEVVVNGVSHTVANSGLSIWNTAKVAAGPAIVSPCLQDVYFATLKEWWSCGPASVTVLVKYGGSTISTTTFTTDAHERYNSGAWYRWMANALGGMYDGPMGQFYHFFVSTIEPWRVKGEYHYFVQEKPRGSFDLIYWVAHQVCWDTPESAIVGQPVPFDLPESFVIQGWNRGDTPETVIVQGWMRNDDPEAVIVGRPISTDLLPDSVMVARRITADTPEALAVYGVNQNNTIELRVLSVEEAAVLAELGILFR